MSRTPTSLLLSVSCSRLSSSLQNLHEIADDILHILIRETGMQRESHLILKQMESIRIVLARLLLLFLRGLQLSPSSSLSPSFTFTSSFTLSPKCYRHRHRYRYRHRHRSIHPFNPLDPCSIKILKLSVFVSDFPQVFCLGCRGQCPIPNFNRSKEQRIRFS